MLRIFGRPPTKLRGRGQAWLARRESRGCPQFSPCFPSLASPSTFSPDAHLMPTWACEPASQSSFHIKITWGP